ncbi:MAG: polysulfide reductase NrfD [Phycisphaerales bacterium]|nr:polysulfide reductase NrfD [Phycisphaerales bacterium]
MARYGFAIDNRVCIGCHACTVACKSEHEVPLGVNRTWVKYIEKGEFPNTRRSFNVQRCNHCEDAPCVEICPVTALHTRPDGIVDFDHDRCIACKACMQACPYDALYLDPETQTAAKCNYCTHRVDAGYEPACVVVCPVEAIVSGDLDDPESRISRLDREQRVQYPKVDKGTHPKLFYVGGETAALDPAAAPPGEQYLWSGNAGEINRVALNIIQGEAEDRARRTYDPRSKPPTWGWMVSAYVTTKAVACGTAVFSAILYAIGAISTPLPTAAFIVTMLFLATTGALLVGDLKQPQRFLYVLLRPQWRSWLVRGAYVISAFGALVPLCWLLGLVTSSRGVLLAVGVLTALAGAVGAVYTAFLLAQAKGRDYWQNPLIVVSMLADALVAGAAAMTLTYIGSDAGAPWLKISTGLLVVLVLAEFLPRHVNKNAELAATLILRGPYATWFWAGVVGVGLILPALALAIGLPWLAAIALLAGIACRNHVLIQAPQRVPLS